MSQAAGYGLGALAAASAPKDSAAAIEFLMTNPYMTASTLTGDGGFVAIWTAATWRRA